MSTAATGLVIYSAEGTPYVFDPGALCLELLLTGGPGELSRYEVLHEPDDLGQWLALSRLGLPPADLRVSPDDLRSVHRLRGALWQLARNTARGEPRRAEDVAEINRVAMESPLVPQLALNVSSTWRLPASGAQVLSTIARDAVDLFSGELATRIRECGDPDCYLIFLDTSAPRRRRWCSMETCGNRNKVRALRSRRSARTPTPATPGSRTT
ncbi:zf-CGNR multi-domain protein [Micromonospora sp. 15K316]|uniref:CGNR zinc finger domain-containing protein n=1 Tax=Micromonospora sp. 15K316 TaxID=2530376 RepID=UPI00104B87BB|nr:CGNR zinc finger domain-containing protein [Micromonospora sp. 15K316]TDC39759.1 zf-CGNR multi-domain protein [Micromonospora sp. 15K316]